jgi:hypothetical protein
VVRKASGVGRSSCHGDCLVLCLASGPQRKCWKTGFRSYISAALVTWIWKLVIVCESFLSQMFLDVPARQLGPPYYGHARSTDLGNSPPMFLGFNNTNHKAALDFVLELAGPRAITPKPTKVLNSDPFLNIDELPVGAFAVDRDLGLTLWNRRLVELTGWTEADIVGMNDFSRTLLEPASSLQTPR